MFYQADKINNLLICLVCEQKMVDPRLLSCGKSVCNRCVDIWTDTDKKRIKCHHCSKTHEIPDEGFLKNLTIQEMLDIEAKEVFRSNQIDEFKTLLNSLSSIRQNIELKLNAGGAQIRDHCDKVRNEMQLAIEQARLKLDSIHKEFIDEIDAVTGGPIDD